MRYDSELMQALLRTYTKVGYYYMEGDLLMCWSPQSLECEYRGSTFRVYYSQYLHQGDIFPG